MSSRAPHSRTTIAALLKPAGAVVGVGLLAAVLAFVWKPGWLPGFGAAPGSRELRGLIDAVARERVRPVEGRLSAAFVYAPARPENRGPSSSEVSPEIRLAAARVERLARDHHDAATRALLGNAYLAIGEWNRAVDALEDAVFQAPASADFNNDLSVAYLARAGGGTTPEDWVAALAAARRAIALAPQRPEPHFNRALAFRGLRLASEEEEAWRAHRALERSEAWSAESAGRLDLVRRRGEQASANVTTSVDRGRLRERIEDDVLREWGAALERGDRSVAAGYLADAERLARQLADAGGDTMPADEVARIVAQQSARNTGAVSALATGHRLYGEARGHLEREALDQASALMSEAATHLRRAGSPYAHMAPVLRALVLRNRGATDAALAELQTVPLNALPMRYAFLHGRSGWIESLVHVSQGRYDRARDRLTAAIDVLRAAGEHESAIATQTNLAEAEWYLGDRSSAWANLVQALADIDSRATTQRTAHFDLAATMARGAGLPEAALEFHDAFVRVTPDDRPFPRADAHLRRARTQVRNGNYAAANEDVAQADKEIAGIAAPTLQAQLRPELEITRAEILAATDCPRAIAHIDTVLPLVADARGTVRRVVVLGLRARCRQQRGDFPGARADLSEAMALVERRRETLTSAADRVQAFELERQTFNSLIALEAGPLRDEAAALRTAERARTGVLAEVWNVEAGQLPDHTSLPRDVAVVYYETLDDRVLTWVLTRARRTFFTREIGEAALRRQVDRIQRAIRQDADLEALRPESAGLFEEIVAPAVGVANAETRAAAGDAATIVFVPDGPLFGLPFGALPDAQGRALLETHVVVVAPSAQTLRAASTRMGELSPTDVLAIGAGHDPAASGLPRLPRADAEAADVASFYAGKTVLRGADATKRRFLAARARVIHFAGHTVLNDRDLLLSRMVFAPDPAVRDSGWLFATEITPERFRGTDVVVLATCDGAAGRPIQGEGAISVARAFFAAGVPAVVASLWPVDDDLQTLMRTLHRSLTTSRDPARALRAGQRAMLAERGRTTPIRVWGGFIMFGGLVPARVEEESRG